MPGSRRARPGFAPAAATRGRGECSRNCAMTRGRPGSTSASTQSSSRRTPLVARQPIGENKGENAMEIVDAQIHLWGSGLPSNLSHRQVTAFTPEEAIALMDEGGVDGAVIHPPGWDPNSTSMASKATQDYPGHFAIMGALPLDRPESRARIAGWRDQPGMLGLRYGFLADRARRWLHDGTLDWLWTAAAEA